MSLCGGAIEIAEFGAGEGLPIALLHEGLGSVAMWRDFPARLAAATGRKVIAWSRQGHGRSAPPDAPFGLDFMHREADAAARLIGEIGIEKAHVFGHSDGASIALLLAARHPQRVASLVLEAPHTFVEPVCLAAIARFRSDAARHALIAGLGKYHNFPTAMLDRWLAIWLDPAFAKWSIEAEVEAIIAPLLLIQGDQDEYGTFSQLDRISDRLARARQLRLERCGHSPHRDQPTAVLRATAQFFVSLEDLSTKAGATL